MKNTLYIVVLRAYASLKEKMLKYKEVCLFKRLLITRNTKKCIYLENLQKLIKRCLEINKEISQI